MCSIAKHTFLQCNFVIPLWSKNSHKIIETLSNFLAGIASGETKLKSVDTHVSFTSSVFKGILHSYTRSPDEKRSHLKKKINKMT